MIRRERKLREELHNPERKNWKGTGRADVMITGDDGTTIYVATINIEAMPLIVEPWMIRRVLEKATKNLTKYVANYGKGKTVN